MMSLLYLQTAFSILTNVKYHKILVVINLVFKFSRKLKRPVLKSSTVWRQMYRRTRNPVTFCSTSPENSTCDIRQIHLQNAFLNLWIRQWVVYSMDHMIVKSFKRFTDANIWNPDNRRRFSNVFHCLAMLIELQFLSYYQR